MTGYLRLAIAALLLVSVACSAGGDDSGDSGDRSAEADHERWECPAGTSDEDDLCLGGDEEVGEAADLIRATFEEADLGALVIGIWRGDDPVVVGALGESMTGVPATPDMAHPVGNISASFLTTVFMGLVDEGVLELDATLDGWFPEYPDSDLITLEQLARSTSGYSHHGADEGFTEAFHSDPFRFWDHDEIVEFVLPQGTAFEPGTDWQFSDTNLLILGDVIEAETGETVHALIDERILGPEGLDATSTRTTGEVPHPTLHGFTDERGVWEDATFWNPSWVPYGGDMVSNQTDVARWLEAVASGALLSEEGHEEHLAPATAGLGSNTDERYYAMGVGVSNGWVFTNPNLQGYRITAGHTPDDDVTIVVVSTLTQDSDPGGRADMELFQELSELLVPENPPAAVGP